MWASEFDTPESVSNDHLYGTLVGMDPETLVETWASYQENGDRDSRNLLAEHYQSLVKFVAAKIGKGLPAMVERDDLISYGNFGLLDALTKYDTSKGVKFETYAVSRIRGAILDELRALDWVPRTVRSKARDVERAKAELQMTFGREPNDVELSVHLGIGVHDLWSIQSQQAMTRIGDLATRPEDGSYTADVDRSITGPADPMGNPESLFETVEIGHMLANAIDNMTPRAKTILSLYYCQEMTLQQIAEVLGVTVSCVCKIQSKILQRLREELGHGAAQMVA